MAKYLKLRAFTENLAQIGGTFAYDRDKVADFTVIARSEATKQIQGGASALDCFVEPVIGPATSAGPVGSQ